jgi:hypothetical protein
MSTTTDVPVRISIEKVIDIEWLGRHTQLIPDQQTYEELVIDVAKEFHIDLDFMNAMCLELSFKSLGPHGKKRRVNAENFASEYKKVRQLVVSVVDQSGNSVEERPAREKDRDREEKKEKDRDKDRDKDREKDREKDKERDKEKHHHEKSHASGTTDDGHAKQTGDRDTL